MKKVNVKTMAAVGMLSSISFILMFLQFPVPPFPPFLTVDFSDVPALVAALIYGPVAGILVEFIKNVLNYLTVGSATGVPVGQTANFFAGVLFILPIYYIYAKLKTKKGMSMALIIGTVSMSVLMSVLNYFVFLPAYTFFLNAPVMSSGEMRQQIVTAILPFNLVKGLIISIIIFLVFIRLQNWINKQKIAKTM